MRMAGCEDVLVNGGKRSKINPGGESSRKNIKRPKRGEANYLPNLPDRQNEESLERARLVLVEEMKKKQHNASLISNMMDQTFSLRRQEIVRKEPAVQDIVERWPALFTEGQVRYFCYGWSLGVFSLVCVFESRFDKINKIKTEFEKE